ncbi:MAG: hypothetical protein KKD39_04080, partial [Candidatus Altiarchaeota archaeon]|nr:hypothetical protein [Candidatus Altiarchaeota archaeon]
MNIRTLHVLVHPGFYSSWMRKHGEKDKIDPEILKMEADLIETYRQKIGTLGNEDVLVILAPTQGAHFKTDVAEGESWVALARDAKTQLGKRCMSVSNPQILENTSRRVSEKDSVDGMMKYLNARGFRITEETACEVWGAAAEECVVQVADAIFYQAPLRKR